MRKGHYKRVGHIHMARTRKRLKDFGRAATAITVVLSLTGCATTGALEKQAGVAPIAADDVCGAQATALRESKGYFERDIVGGAMAGALVGALAGAVIGGSSKDIAKGALAGLAVGAAGGYLKARSEAAADRASLVGTVYQDMQRESAEITRALAAFQAVRACRLARADTIRAQFKSGAMDRPTAEAALAKERARYADDIAIARTIGAKISSRQMELGEAANALAADNPEATSLMTRLKAAEQEQAAQAATFVAVTTKAPVEMAKASNVANVRGEPSTSGAKVGQLAVGEAVEVLDRKVPAWPRVKLADGTIGYVSAKLLQDGAPAPAKPQAPPVSKVKQLVDTVPTSAAPEARVVAGHYEGVSKKQEFDKVTDVAAAEESTRFQLDLPG